jgi:6-phosphogluconolactonase (cycloisomerase 2 family)
VGIVANNQFVYVIDQDTATTQNLLGFAVNSTTGLLTPLAGVTVVAANAPSPGYTASAMPAGIIEDAALQHLYVSDQTGNQILGYTVATTGVPALNGTAPTDVGPAGMAIDVSGKYLYVANTTGGTIGGYTFGTSGQPVASTVAKSTQSGTGTNCVTIIGAPTDADPSHAVYLYASNGLSNTVTAQQLNLTNGSLENIQGTPFGASAFPGCLVSVPSFPR